MKFFNGLIKWLLVIIIGLSAALLAIIFLSNSEAINQFLLRLVILLAIGFFGGLAGRVLFPKTPAFLTLLMVTTASLLSALLIDLFYETPYQLDIVAANFSFPEFSISDGSQIGMMILAALLPMLVMRHPVQNSVPAEAQKPKRKKIPLSNRMASFLHQIDPRSWQIVKPTQIPKKKPVKASTSSKIQTQPKTAAKTKVNKPASSASTLTISRAAVKAKSAAKIHSGNGRKPTKVKQAPGKLKLPTKILSGKANDVKLVGEEEHVCPYCLDEVVKGDERGTVVCPECGTWHHQDCWNLTGTCGVAHRNEL
jgi:ribosomal protein L37AE/L43A